MHLNGPNSILKEAKKSCYHTIVADPPWPYDHARAMPVKTSILNNAYGGNVSSVERYGSMSIDEIKHFPVKKLAADQAHLYIWTTNSFMVEAHEIAIAWGFIPKTILTWVKIKHGKLLPSMKAGYYFRGATEHVVFAVRGVMKLQNKIEFSTAFFHERLPHSTKPEAFLDMVEKCSPPPYLELFARRIKSGWYQYGNEIIPSLLSNINSKEDNYKIEFKKPKSKRFGLLY